MSSVKTLKMSFSGGEVTPELFGRIDDAKYQSGLAKCRNFITKPQGPAENRSGFAFVREVKNSAKKTRLISFTYSTTQTMVIELGAGYFRFHTMGATLMNGSVPYEIANPYQEADLFDINHVQSADVLTIVHPNYPPKELRRYGALDWRIEDISFSPPIQPPPAPVLASRGQTEDKYTYYYVVTSISEDGFSESSQSPQSSIGGNLFETGAIVSITWSSVAGASRYNIYKLQGGLFGFIGQTDSLEIVDDNIAPDMSKTPPRYDSLFSGVGNYPGAVSYFEQRRCFAGTKNMPQNMWMTKSGTESNMSFSLPIRDDDRISFRVAAREANTIRHIVPLAQLVMLTSAAEWRVTSLNSDAITPTTISVRPQSYVGASNVQPVIVNNTAIYGSARGGHIRELGYNWQANGFITGDLSLRAPHLFDGKEIVDMAYAKSPYPVVWNVSSDGRLLGLTYVPEEQVAAWHWHDTDGTFESCATVTEGYDDALYCVVRRFINGNYVRYIERMGSRRFDKQEDAFFVDSGLTYRGAPVTRLTGLTHLEGKKVSILANGAVMPQEVVTNGAIDIDEASSVIHVGLPIDADLQTLPATIPLKDGSYGQGTYKNVNKVWLRVYRSSGIFVGPDENNLVEIKNRSNEPFGTPPALKSEELSIVLTPKWADSGQIYIRQRDPLPLTVASMTAQIALGG